jgi:hypothetical protein
MVLGSGRFVARVAVLVGLVILVSTAEARAQSSIGFTGGASIDPEQVYAGVFWQSPDFGGTLRIRPGIDGGFSDGLRLGIVNVDLIYLLPLGQGPWKFVTGGGPAVVLRRWSDEAFDTGTEVTAGGSYLFGFAHDNGFFTEFRVGGWNVPALKIGVGYAVKLN